VLQLVEVFGFLSVILRGCTLALQTLAVGGVVFLLFALREPDRRLTRALRWSALALAGTQALFLAVDSAVLSGTVGLTLSELAGANYFTAACLTIAASLILAALPVGRLMLLPALAILAGTLATSHAMARLDQRVTLAAFTLLHQAATAIWIGGLPYLILARRPASHPVWKRFSVIALSAFTVLALSGLAMSYSYVGSIPAVYGTAYGIMVAAKVALFGALTILGAVNYFAVRGHGLIARLRGITEAEIGIGFCVIFAAASLTSQPPAVDVASSFVPAHVVAERIAPRVPSLSTPSVSSLTLSSENRNSSDLAWSEYNHHWAGLVVLAMGLLAILSRTGVAPWARHWPLLFVGLGLFLLLRADADVWPLGPKGFWESLSNAEILQHRLAVLLVFAFAAFEWGVQTSRLTSLRAALVFPAVCALGGALLLTHSHSLSNVREELLAELSHVPLAIFGIAAGWARWLELRLPVADRPVPAAVWPVCFSLVGVVLLLYRES
jgi:putative copper resistance protein D